MVAPALHAFGTIAEQQVVEFGVAVYRDPGGGGGRVRGHLRAPQARGNAATRARADDQRRDGGGRAVERGRLEDTGGKTGIQARLSRCLSRRLSLAVAKS